MKTIASKEEQSRDAVTMHAFLIAGKTVCHVIHLVGDVLNTDGAGTQEAAQTIPEIHQLPACKQSLQCIDPAAAEGACS